MGILKQFVFSFTVLFFGSSAFGNVAQSDQNRSQVQFEPVKTKILASAIHNFQVKRLKKMLDQRKISSEQFFSKIEGIIRSDNSNR